MSTRERFEAWAVKPERSLSIDRHPDYPDAYLFWMTEQSWAAYKAARAEALEEAAEVCDEAARRCKSNSMAVSSTHARDNWLSEADSHIVNADAIRALKDKEPA